LPSLTILGFCVFNIDVAFPNPKLKAVKLPPKLSTFIYLSANDSSGMATVIPKKPTKEF